MTMNTNTATRVTNMGVKLRTDNKTIPTTNTVVNLLTPNQTIRTVYTQADPTMSNKSTGVGG
ncbi:hypothetical protein HanRHA438_Chr03g0135161 [Helianthus annuus]|nr:hypothetical protein HanRHA438_Chr03g0135161 [Helianthus annuus]